MLRDMTIYELNRAFATTLALFYSASLGSLQVAVRKLLSRRLIGCRETREGGRRKKIYRVLAAGRAAFFETMAAPIPPKKLEVTALSRLSFLGLLDDAAAREAVLAMIERAVDEALAGLRKLEGELARTEVPPSYRRIFHYQRKTLDYGIDAHQAALDWFRALIKEERAGRGSRPARPPA